MKKLDENEIRDLLKRSIRPADAQLQRDLWPEMLRRMQEHPGPVIPWFDWALMGLLIVCAVAFPGSVPLLLYHL